MIIAVPSMPAAFAHGGMQAPAAALAIGRIIAARRRMGKTY